MYRCTLDGRVLLANSSLAHLLGFDTPEQLTTALNERSHQLYVDPERRTEFVRLLEQDDMAKISRARSIGATGAAFRFSVPRAQCVRDGTVLYVEGNVQDITARKEMEPAYQRLSLESMQSIVIIQNRRPVFVNAQMSEALGYTTAEVMDFRVEQLIALVHPDDREHLATAPAIF